MFSASTYADTVGLTFTSDRLMMPDPEVMRECLDEAVAAVAQLKVGKPARAKRAGKQAAKKRRTTRAPKSATAAIPAGG